MVKSQAIGLLVFAFVVWLDVAGLAFDQALIAYGYPTMTEFARRNPWAAMLFISLNVIGTLGLIFHLTNTGE